MTIIAISGHANVGKTTTVKQLIEILKIESNKKGYSVLDISQEYTLVGNFKIFKIKELNTIIGFGLDGDFVSQVEQNCKNADSAKVDIFIQTTRTKGQGVDYLYHFAKNQHDIIQIGTINNYFGLPSKFLADDSSFDVIKAIQTKNVWNLLLYILQKNYNFKESDQSDNFKHNRL